MLCQIPESKDIIARCLWKLILLFHTSEGTIRTYRSAVLAYCSSELEKITLASTSVSNADAGLEVEVSGSSSLFCVC